MFYFSSFINRTIKDEEGRKIGVLDDMIMNRDGNYPPITALVMKSKRSLRRILWDRLKHIDQEGAIIHGTETDFEKLGSAEDETLLKRDILDKQIVDIDGHRVIRVNDIQINRLGGDFLVAGVDVGTPGLLRRMGLLEFAQTISDTLKLKTPTNIIPWEDIQGLGGKEGSSIVLSTSCRKLNRLHPADLAEILEELSRKERDQFFGALDMETAVETLEQMEEDTQLSLLNGLSDEKAADLLEEMSPDVAADLLQEIPDDRAEALLKLMDAEDARDVKELMVYGEDTAGGFMNTEFVWANPEMTCVETLDLIRRLSPEAEIVYYIYVVDDADKLLGVLSLRDIIVADPGTVLNDIMHTEIFCVGTGAGINDIAEMMVKYDLLAVPVVDNSIIKGIVTVDDVMEEIFDG